MSHVYMYIIYFTTSSHVHDNQFDSASVMPM